MYSTDWFGRYPINFPAGVTPNYLKTIPTCPSAGAQTCIGSYTSASEPDAYTIFCSGLNHAGASITVANYPQYTAVEGLIERP